MHQNASFCGAATVGAKGQIVIPADAREKLGIQPGDKVFIMCAGPKGNDMLGICTEKSMRGIMDHMSQKLSLMQQFIEPDGSEVKKG
jgi:AbrB family looped-hinge helix DNA binding protein